MFPMSNGNSVLRSQVGSRLVLRTWGESAAWSVSLLTWYLTWYVGPVKSAEHLEYLAFTNYWRVLVRITFYMPHRDHGYWIWASNTLLGDTHSCNGISPFTVRLKEIKGLLQPQTQEKADLCLRWWGLAAGSFPCFTGGFIYNAMLTECSQDPMELTRTNKIYSLWPLPIFSGLPQSFQPWFIWILWSHWVHNSSPCP